MAGPSTAVTMTTGVAAAMTVAPFGISLETLVLGGACYLAGSCARTGLVLYKQLDGPGSVTLAREIAKLLCTVPLAAAASCMVFFAAHMSGFSESAYAACGGVLMVAGIKGPEGFQWLADRMTSIFSKGAPGASQEGKP